MHLRKAGSCLLLGIALSPIGCTPVTAPNQPAPPIATGYGSVDDQNLGLALASMRALAAAAHDDYARLTPDQQAAVKVPLNGFIMAMDAADQTYVAYHSGLVQFPQAQQAFDKVAPERSAYTAAMAGVR